MWYSFQWVFQLEGSMADTRPPLLILLWSCTWWGGVVDGSQTIIHWPGSSVLAWPCSEAVPISSLWFDCLQYTNMEGALSICIMHILHNKLCHVLYMCPCSRTGLCAAGVWAVQPAVCREWHSSVWLSLFLFARVLTAEGWAHLFGQRWVQYCGNLCAKVAAELSCLAVGNVGWNGIEWWHVQVASQILALTLNSYWPWHSIWQQQFICSILNSWKTPVWPLANFSLVLIATNELFHYCKIVLTPISLVGMPESSVPSSYHTCRLWKLQSLQGLRPLV